MAGLKRISDQNKFRAKCDKAVRVLDIDEPLYVTGDARKEDDEFEDDGSLHIRRAGLRAVFGVSNGQEATGIEQNRQTRAVMEALGMKRKITDRVLVEEDNEDEEDYCESCGRSCAC